MTTRSSKNRYCRHSSDTIDESLPHNSTDVQAKTNDTCHCRYRCMDMIKCPLKVCNAYICAPVGTSKSCYKCGSTVCVVNKDGSYRYWVCPYGHTNKGGSYCYINACNYSITQQPATQKAKGVFALADGGGQELEYTTIESNRLKLIKAASAEYDIFRTKLIFPCFARPCPVKPEHGFIDSRIVNNSNELLALVKEVAAVSMDAEILLMPFIDASYNMVLTPSMITIGPGNAGATTGENAVEIPIVYLKNLGIRQDVLQAAGITKTPYFEAVYTEKNRLWTATQLRDGPPVSYCIDYIPHRMKVRNVIVLRTYYTLTQWKKQLESASNGTVVHNLINVGLGSHYGVHCILNKIPFIRSFTPVVGMIVNPTQQDNNLSRKGLLEGLTLGFTIQRNGFNWHDLGVFSLAALHNIPAFGARQSRFVGFGVAVAIRLGLMALYGESRHPIRSERRAYKHKNLPEREQVYDASWEHLRDSLDGMDELKLRWKKDWEGSFGGPKWLKCHNVLNKLLSATVALAESKTDLDKHVAKLVNAYNTMINTVHNGGKWFNKFYRVHLMDIASEMPGVLAAMSAHVFYNVANLEPKELTVLHAMRTNLSPESIIMRPWDIYKGQDEECDEECDDE